MKLHIFSGTKEGRELCGFASENGIPAEAYVATEYGRGPLGSMKGINVNVGRMDAEDMSRVLGPDALVIDATHPYAAEATQNIRKACEKTGAEYWRLKRPALNCGDVETVPDLQSAAVWLNAHPGRVLVTTGSKGLEAFTTVEGYRERVFVRVLPGSEVLRRCESLGFPGRNIIAMQGPFSHGMNVECIKSTGADFLITKDTGEEGGFRTKLSAAKETGTRVVVVSRPTDEDGMTLKETLAALSRRCGAGAKKRFPVFVSLEGEKCVVFGAGNIACRRAGVLKRFGAGVKVIAPESRSELIPDEARGYEESDLEGAFLVVAATDNREANHRIGEGCAKRGVLCSVADSAEESTFFFPAICEGEELTVGVVSSGKSHNKTAGAAKRIRGILEEIDGKDKDRQP